MPIKSKKEVKDQEVQETKPKRVVKKTTKKAEKPKKVTKKITKKAEKPKKVVKKTTKKAEKPKKVTKKTTKKAEKPKKVVKKATKKVVKPKKVEKPKFDLKTKYAAYVSEALTSLLTEDNKWVSFQKIKGYIYDYIVNNGTALITHNVKTTLEKMTELKLVKVKKHSFAFTALGKKHCMLESVPKRTKIERPVEEEVEEKPVEHEVFITASGRLSQKLF